MLEGDEASQQERRHLSLAWIREKKVTDLQGGVSARLDITGNCILSPSSCVTPGFCTIKCELKGAAVFHNHRC